MRSLPYKVSSSTYLGLLTRLWWSRHWPIPAAIIAIILIYGSYSGDLRYFYLSAILLCLVGPLSLLLIYRHALHPHAVMSITARSVEATDNGLDLELAQPSDTDDIADNESDEDIIPTIHKVIPWSHIKAIGYTGRYFLIHLPGKYQILPIPYTAFASKDDLRAFSTFLNRHRNNDSRQPIS